MNNHAHRSGLIALAILVVLLLLIGAVVYFFKIPLPAVPGAPAIVQDSISAATLPEALKTGQFIGKDSAGKVTIYGVEGVSFVVQEDKALARLNSMLSEKLTQKDRAVFSTNEKWAVYESDAATIVAIDVKTGTKKTLGTGVYPFFVEEFTTGRFSKGEIVLTNLESMKETNVAITDAPFDMAGGISVSPNRALVAWRSKEDGSVAVYNITPAGGRLITRHSGNVDSFAIGNRELYLLRVTEEGTEIVRFSFNLDAKEEVIHIFPTSLGITEMKLY